MVSRVKKFALLEKREQRQLLRIWMLLGWTRLQLSRRGFSPFVRNLAAHRGVPVAGGISPRQREQAVELGRLVSLAARHAPWQSRCLAQVLVLQRLLEQQQIPGFFSLGVRKSGDQDALPLDAHAWLQCGDEIVHGVVPGEAYSTLSSFSWGLRADNRGTPTTMAARQSPQRQ